MQAVPLSKALGAELVDVDITAPFSADEQAELRRLFCHHHLLLVRGQELTAEDQDRFVGSFGPLQKNRAGDSAGYVTNQDHPRSLFGKEMYRLLWHGDGAYTSRPGIATSLWAEDVSPTATPTEFANVVEIVDRLPADLRAKVERYRIMNVRDTAFNRTTERVTRDEILNTDDTERYVTYVHPILFDPPHLDKKAVIASEFMTSYVVDVPLEESDAFLEELYGHLYADDNVYTHQWRSDDLIIWDNIALHHGRPRGVDLDSPRHMRRQCIDGWYTDDGDVIDWALAAILPRAHQQM
jgi:taurine dioxygenase